MAFRRRKSGKAEPQEAATLRRLVAEDAPMGVPGIVLQELLSGVRTPQEFDRLVGVMEGFALVVAQREDQDGGPQRPHPLRGPGEWW